MSMRYRNEISEIRKSLASLAGRVADNVSLAFGAVLAADAQSARQVVSTEHDINRQEVGLEEACIRVITLHQPVADDLRFLMATLKVNHDLERIGDLAAGVAKRTHAITPQDVAPFEEELRQLTGDVETRLRQSMAAFFVADHRQATRIWIGDDAVDAVASGLYDDIRAAITGKSDRARALFTLLEIAQRIERLADHGANIAKNVIYLAMGEIVRHRMREFRREAVGDRPNVLMVCVHNSARSQMAAAWMNHLYGDIFHAESAGLEPGELNPLTVAAMKEVGIDISGARPRDVFEVLRTGHPFTHVVMVCDETSAEKCPPFPGVKDVVHWDLPDPAAGQEKASQKIETFREIRDELRRRIDDWVNALSRSGSQDS